ncbi:MAG: acyltransferase [Methylobacter sp.]|jgi:peptidoglycan/LPS O-acetylase OafA/YrhL
MDLLLIIRGLAALSVVVWHAVGHHNTFPPMINIPGRTAVWLFFGLSGYVIAHGFIHKRYTLSLGDLRDFYTNRFLRIYPLFLTLSALGWITELLSTGSNPLSLKDLPAQLIAFQFDQSYVLNGVFWTLGIEIQFYLLAPLIVLPILRSTDKQQLLLVCSIYIAMVYWNYYAVKQFGWSYDGRNVISNLPHFFIGMAACQIVSTLKPSTWRLSISIVSACILLSFANWLYNRYQEQYWSIIGILLVDLIIFLFILAHASCERDRFKTHPAYIVFAFLGTLSYGIYAWHSYLMKCIPQMSDHVIALIAASIVMAYMSYRFIESPALKMKRRHSRVEWTIK